MSDPNVALNVCRKMTKEILSDLPISNALLAAYATTLAEQFDALDDWMVKNGFSPWEIEHRESARPFKVNADGATFDVVADSHCEAAQVARAKSGARVITLTDVPYKTYTVGE